MGRPAAKRDAVAHLRGVLEMSERRACDSLPPIARRPLSLTSTTGYRAARPSARAADQRAGSAIGGSSSCCGIRATQLSGCSHCAKGRINSRGSNRHWMKVQWQVTPSKLGGLTRQRNLEILKKGLVSLIQDFKLMQIFQILSEPEILKKFEKRSRASNSRFHNSPDCWRGRCRCPHPVRSHRPLLLAVRMISFGESPRGQLQA